MSAISRTKAAHLSPAPNNLPFPKAPSDAVAERPLMDLDVFEGASLRPAGVLAGTGFGVANGFAGGTMVAAIRLGPANPLAWAIGLAAGAACAVLGAYGGGRIGQALAERRAGTLKLEMPSYAQAAAGLAGGALGLGVGAGAALMFSGPLGLAAAMVLGSTTAVLAALGAADLAGRMAGK